MRQALKRKAGLSERRPTARGMWLLRSLSVAALKRVLSAYCLLATAFCLLCQSLATAQQIHRNPFETRDVYWVKGTADAPFRQLAHEITETRAHTGQSSEHLQITAEQGNYVYYYYPTDRAPISEELSASVWVKANRPGVQLLARLVLPKERNPKNLDEPVTTLLRGDLHQSSQWQRLELRRPAKLANQQQQHLRAQLKRNVDFTDAYIDQLILNVYAGPGLTEVWIDDLEIGPVLETRPFQITSRETGSVKLQAPGEQPHAPSRPAVVDLDQNQLLVNGRRFFIRGIRHTDTPLKTLRDAGFNTIWFDHATSPAVLEEAIKQGFWLVPTLPVTAKDPSLSSPENLRREIARFMEKDAVLFWDLGGGLTDEQTGLVAQAARLVRASDLQRPVGADVWDGFRPYSRNLDLLLGVHRWPLMTGLELPKYREWLNQRRLLARPGAFMWTWVQTHLPDWYTTLVYDRPAAAGFDEPIGPQPEQIHLLTYTAIAAGCRGLGFWSDRFLADSHQGRDRLLALALVNQELKMLEPLLATAEEPSWIDTSLPEVKAAVLRTERGVLVLPIWLGKGAQYVPGQSAAANLKIEVPQVPAGTQPWIISPAEVRALRQERVVGGTRVTLPEFGLTAAILFTADNGPNGILVRLQDQARQAGKVAAQWSIYLAEQEISKVARVQEQLEGASHHIPDGQALLADARRRLRSATENFNKGDYREAYGDAQRALRPLRILMRAYWEQATKELDVPVASQYAVSFYTLPRHWRFMDLVHQGRPGANVLPNGDFEVSPDRAPEAWLPQETTLDEVDMVARRVTTEPKEGRQCLMLQITPKNPLLPPAALERTFLAINSPAVRLQPGTLVQISGWVRIPSAIVSSADGALLYDSAGGEPLAIRLTDATKWKQFKVYRRVPASGQINVTLALTGLGTVFFDDIRIEPLLWNTTAARPPER